MTSTVQDVLRIAAAELGTVEQPVNRQKYSAALGRPAESERLWRGTSFAERFWANVNFLGRCWEWTGYRGTHGYGTQGRTLAHRYAYEYTTGPIPEGLQLDHLCRNRGCVNPSHLEPVTQRSNILRGTGPSAYAAQQTHCSAGHEYTPGSTYVRIDGGGRQCRICKARRMRKVR